MTCGSMLGMAITYFSYRRYYPRLHSSNCDEPFLSRESSFNDAKLKTDEETGLRAERDYELTDSDDGTTV